ncbi:hypothetical protein D3C84_1090000 [compost metagenome]
MADAGGGKGAVQADFHSAYGVQQMLVNQCLGKGRGGAHRTDGMRTGRTDADFEKIKNTDSHAKAYTSNGREIAAIFVGQAQCRRYCLPRSYVTNETS